jgi:hypothetical protein
VSDVAFVWALPAAGAEAAFNGPDGNVELLRREFATLADYSRATGQDRNSIIVDYDVFVNVPALDARDSETILLPARCVRLRSATSARKSKPPEKTC